MTVLGSRSSRPEILDRTDIPAPDLAGALAMVTEVNRRLGGVRSLWKELAPLHGRDGVRLLDLGTGNGEVLRDLLDRGRKSGGRGWWGAGLDLTAAALQVAASLERRDGSGPHLVRGDALRLPFRTNAFDAAFATLTLHHFSDEDAAAVVAEMARVSRGLVVVSDLERSLPALVGARILAATRWRKDLITRHDGPLSVRRSFTIPELRAIGRTAALDAPRVRRHFPFRLVLVGGRP